MKPPFLSLFSQFNLQGKFWIFVYQHSILAFGVPSAYQAPFGLSSPNHKYPALNYFVDGSLAVDDYARSWAENVPPNLATSPSPSPSPETLAGGPYSRDVIMGFGFVNMILSLVRDLEEDLFMGPTCHNDTNLLFGACKQILLVTTTEVSLFLVTSAADANGCDPCSVVNALFSGNNFVSFSSYMHRLP
ncbi:hypothetical protein NC652_002365 [Populus alba x Populus x berolinensis]|nr:hypothetical protein NC652_002365 [Populus alba x Populus x berolinensis]